MTDEPDNLILRQLRRMDAKLDKLSEDMTEIKARLTAVEAASVRMQHTLDRLDVRVSRIERRLDLVGDEVETGR